MLTDKGVEYSSELEKQEKLLIVVDNPELAGTIRVNAREFQEKRAVEARQNGDRLYATFKAVIENCEEGKEIPQELLFDPDRDD